MDGGQSLVEGMWVLDYPIQSIAPWARSAPSSRGGPRMIRGPDDPPAQRVRNLSHLWGRLRDFYQVRVWEGEAEPGSPLRKAQLMISHPLFTQEELQLLILSPPPDLQTLGVDPFSGTLCPTIPPCI